MQGAWLQSSLAESARRRTLSPPGEGRVRGQAARRPPLFLSLRGAEGAEAISRRRRNEKGPRDAGPFCERANSYHILSDKSTENAYGQLAGSCRSNFVFAYSRRRVRCLSARTRAHLLEQNRGASGPHPERRHRMRLNGLAPKRSKRMTPMPSSIRIS